MTCSPRLYAFLNKRIFGRRLNCNNSCCVHYAHYFSVLCQKIFETLQIFEIFLAGIQAFANFGICGSWRDLIQSSELFHRQRTEKRKQVTKPKAFD